VNSVGEEDKVQMYVDKIRTYSSCPVVQSGSFYMASFGCWLREEHHHVTIKSRILIGY